MRGRKIDLTGQVFGRLTVIQSEGVNKHGCYLWLCECECGNTKIVNGAELRRGHVKSCGCLSNELARERLYQHGASRTPIYREWAKMKGRCNGNTAYSKRRYTDRGIKVCSEWVDNFSAFYDHVSELENYGKTGYSLDRIDNDRDYEPGNVRWADPTTQANNRNNNIIITYRGETHTQAEWARIMGIKYSTLQQRLLDGWDVEKALTTPVKTQKKGLK